MIVFEQFARKYLAETMYLPGEQISKVQSYLKLHPSLGFLWKENINYADSVMLPWSDQDTYPLSTDSNGFRNHPATIMTKQKITIIGLGDSFIHDASYSFSNYFLKKGIIYYNLAMHRHSPPQYNIILKEYALRKNPEYIIYGIYENDFEESVDFLNWENSNLDWFKYHSGVWGGSVTIDDLSKPYSIPYVKGSYAFFRLLNDRCSSLFKQNDSHMGKEIVYSKILEALQISKKNNIKFILVLIPSKETMKNRKLNVNYDQLMERLKHTEISIIDLRNYFSNYTNIDKLYYKKDGHWNNFGIKESAKFIYDYINKLE